MSIIRGAALFLLSSILVVSLLMGNLALTMYLSVGSENFKESIVEDIASVLKNQTNADESIQNALPGLREQCAGKSEIIINYGDFNATIQCDNLEESSDQVIKQSITEIIDQETSSEICDSPLNCFSKYKGLFFSDGAKNYWKGMFVLSLFISLALIGGMFFFVENRVDLPVSVGFLVAFSSLPFIVINFMLPYFDNGILKPIATIFSSSYTVFITMLGIGVLLVVMGFGLKFIKIGEYISKKFDFKKKSDKKGEAD
ncbi:MAG: hypothetical protein AABX93_03060 [Nanoarchaeota archaeon]